MSRDATASLEIERLSNALAGGSRDPVILHHARIAAEAELEIMRVRSARAALVNVAARDRMTFVPLVMDANWDLFRLARRLRSRKFAADADKAWAFVRPPIPAEPERTTVAVLRAAVRLPKYERYERRALSRRRHALRALDLAVSRMGS